MLRASWLWMSVAIVWGCGANGGGGAIPGAGDSFTFTSSLDNGHTHTFTVASETLANPPEGGIEGETSESLGHTHLVTLSEAELLDIQAGLTVVELATIADGHSHTFDFKKDLGLRPTTLVGSLAGGLAR